MTGFTKKAFLRSLVVALEFLCDSENTTTVGALAPIEEAINASSSCSKSARILRKRGTREEVETDFYFLRFRYQRYPVGCPWSQPTLPLHRPGPPSLIIWTLSSSLCLHHWFSSVSSGMTHKRINSWISVPEPVVFWEGGHHRDLV